LAGSSDPNTVSFGFAGDICLSLEVINSVRRYGPRFPFEKVAGLYERVDLVVGNLECCITEKNIAEAPSQPPLRVPIDVADALRQSGIDVLGLANNHVMDMGVDGLRSTMRYLDDGGFRHFGAGMTLRMAEAPLFVEASGVRLAFLGACDISNCWAREDQPGVAPLSERRLLRRVAAVKDSADLVVVCLHADLEFVRHPAPWRQRLSRRLIESGAAMVVQHHPHVCQGIEQYRDGLVAYSLGNHVFQVHDSGYQMSRSGTADGVFLEVGATLRDGRRCLGATTHPLKIDSTHRPVPCDPNEAERRRREIDELSSELLDPHLVRESWRATCRTQVAGQIMDNYYTMMKYGVRAVFNNDIAAIRSPERRRWMYGFLSAGYL
jgi:poly-gamma-glutamate synthesis protein (capsule biosynthesis protein)